MSPLPISAAPSGPIDLRGRVAIVTGAATGLGRTTAEVLAAAGAQVALADLRSSAETLTAILEGGGQAHSFSADVTKREMASATVEEVMEMWRRVDILVNNAGVGGRIGLQDIDDEAFERQVSVNLKGAMYWTQAVAPRMAAAGGGKIVNISSISARTGGVDSVNPVTGAGRSGPIYAAAKGGVLAFTRWAARDIGPSGILVNAICPGPTSTESTQGFEYDLRAIPIPHLASANDIAYAVLFLASQMSNHITGQALNVDGGMRMD